jgi:hypothetical protein
MNFTLIKKYEFTFVVPICLMRILFKFKTIICYLYGHK